MIPYNPLQDEHLTATAFRVVLQSDLECHEQWTARNTHFEAWTWEDTRNELAMWETRSGSGTEFLMCSRDVLDAMPLVVGMSQHDMARVLYESIAAQIDRMTYEQARIMMELPR